MAQWSYDEVEVQDSKVPSGTSFQGPPAVAGAALSAVVFAAPAVHVALEDVLGS